MANNAVNLITDGFGGAFSPVFNKVLLAVVILLIGFVAGKIAGLIVKRLLSGISVDKHIRNAGVKLSVERFLGGVVSFVIYVITLLISLNTLGLTSTIITIITLGILFILGVSLLLAIKDFFPNMISGIRIRTSGLFHEGDAVKIKEVKGIIKHVGLLETRLMTDHHEEIIIPNALFIKRRIFVDHKHKMKKK
jgi:small conductance mechanosensitive channel